MIGKRLKYAQRYQEILTALLKNGLGFIVKDLGLLGFKRKAEADSTMYSKSIAERIRSVLEELGPTFVKLGQLASTRVDLIPENIIKELEKLQDHVAPIPFSDVEKIIEKELGQPANDLFLEVNDRPIASASIGQVHYGKLPTGQEVAIKVQRPNIEEKIDIDLQILSDLTNLMEEKLEWANNYRISEIVEEVSRSLRLELDYTVEAWNGEKIARQLKEHPNYIIPSIHWEYTTKRILTMDYISGTRLRDYAKNASEAEKKLVAKQFVECMFQQIFIDGFFHGDPHPGNLFVLPDKRMALIDFGMIGRLSPSMKNDLASVIIALKNRDINEVIFLFLKLGQSSEPIDNDQIYADIEVLIEMNMDIPLQQISLANLINNLMEISFKYRVRMPADLTILAKTLLTMEGILSHLDKDLSIIDMAHPFGEKLIRERLKPSKIMKETRNKLREIQTFLTQLMKSGSSITKDGKIHVEISVPEVKNLSKKLDRVTNQLSFSIILLAFSIMMVGLVVGASISNVKTFLWNFPVVEVGGVVATLMFLWLLFSILKHGKF